MDALEFAWPIRIYYEDTDAGGVVFYANYLRYMERARTEWLRALGFEQDALMRDPGVLFAVRRVALEYERPARFNDELVVRSTVERVTGASIDFDQRVCRRADGALLCGGRVQVVCLRSADMRPTRIPTPIRQRLEPNRDTS
jgi:acyl-CoA thioester hydrolase